MLMTKELEKQLSKLTIPYHATETGIVIEKQNPEAVLTFEPYHFYLIHMDQGANAKQLMKLTAMNWNQGREIISEYLKCEYLRTMGPMVQLNASGYNPDTGEDLPDVYLNIWVNSNIIKIVDELR